ncbi:MAG TPA: hypothetical protein VMJ33_10240 [Gallionella sp.]|nr:hypothetical protein [Gallionella sp.]
MLLGVKLNFARLTGASSWLGMIILYVVMLLWHRMAAGDLSIITVAWFFSLLLVSLLAGDLFLKWGLRDSERFNNLPTKLLTGMLCANVAMFIASLVLPFGLAIDWMIFLIVVLILWIRARRTSTGNLMPAAHISETFFIVAIAIAVTAWCLDVLRPIESIGGVMVIRVWPDIYYHVSEIAAFATSKGIGTISDVHMVGEAMRPYHVGSYVLPAVFVAVTGSSALIAYKSLLVPLGILITALAAYSLGNIAFGKWPAMAAGLALMLLPDAFQQGFGNGYLSYQWLQQIQPAAGYGIACAAVAFMFMLEGCSTNRYRLILLGYFFALVTLLFKAHIFVAISFLAFVFPVLFMKGRTTQYRFFMLLALTCIYVGVAALSQMSLSVPILRLDGSGLETYASNILELQASGIIKNAFIFLFDSAGNNWHLEAGTFALMLVICTFGVFPVLYAVVLRHLKRRFEPMIWLFPMLVVAVYLIMATGLALNDRPIGTHSELLHRPFVWAYFVVVVWSAGAIYYRLFGDALPANKQIRWSLVLLALALEFVPVSYGKGVQTLTSYVPGTNIYVSWGNAYQEVPACLVKIAGFIRKNAKADDVVQDSMNDPHFILSAFSERYPYAIAIDNQFRSAINVQPRLDSLQRLKEIKDSNEVESFMKEHAMRWYVVDPTDNVQWADAAKSHLLLTCGGYRAYQF